MRGNSFERSIFLDSIGVKLGEDRWRISPRTFISDCGNAEQIEERIKKFKNLIDEKPAPHWELLFERAKKRAGYFDKKNVEASVFFLNEDRELIEELLNDSALSACAYRAEGGFLIVPEKLKRRFKDFLLEHGIAYFS